MPEARHAMPSYPVLSLCVIRRRIIDPESVHQSEGLRRDGAYEHLVFQQRAAGEALLHEPPHVCLLMHVGAAQARTRMYQERQRVTPATQVADCNHMMSAYPSLCT
jgi:hypothetical protein